MSWMDWIDAMKDKKDHTLPVSIKNVEIRVTAILVGILATIFLVVLTMSFIKGFFS